MLRNNRGNHCNCMTGERETDKFYRTFELWKGTEVKSVSRQASSECHQRLVTSLQ